LAQNRPSEDFPFDREFLAPGALRFYQAAARALLLTHPLLNRDELLPRLENHLMRKARKQARVYRQEKVCGPLLSVALFGAEKAGIEATLAALEAQTCRDFEIILAVPEVFTDFKTDLPLLRVNAPVPNPESAWKLGSAQGRGRYLLPLEAGLIPEPTALEKALALLESRPELSWAELLTGSETFRPIPKADQWGDKRFCPALIFRRASRQNAEEGKTGAYPDSLRRGLPGEILPEPLLNYPAEGNFAPLQLSGLPDRTLTEQPFLNLEQSAPKTRPRILLALPWLCPGGGERVVLDILGHFKNDFDFYILATDRDKTGWYPRFYEITKKIFLLPHFLAIRYWADFFLHLVKAHQIDLILSQAEFHYRHAAPRLKAEHPEVRQLVIVHNDLKDGHLPKAARQAAYLDGYIAVSRQIERALRQDFEIEPEKVHLIYNGIDLEKQFNPENYPEKALLREKLGLPPDKKLALFLGRLAEEKRPGDFVALARKFQDRPEWFFLLAGEGELRPALEKQASGLNNLKMPGHCEKVPELLAAGEVLILTSEVESSPYVIKEALAMGLPVISSRAGEAEVLIGEGQNGFLAQVGAVDEMAAKLQALCDPGFYAGIKAHCRDSVKAYSLEKIREGYRRVFAL